MNKCEALTTMPKDIAALTRLETLHLGDTALTALPSGIGNLTRLRELWLAVSEKAAQQPLPEGLSNLTGLDTLGVQMFDAEDLSFLGELVGLRQLNLSDLFVLEELPASISRLSALDSLEIINCSNLRGLPRCAGQLRALRKLSLQYMRQLRMLPDEMGSLTMLESLDLWACPRLQQLPASISRLTRLQALSVEMCPIKNLPCIEPLTALRVLRLVYGSAFSLDEVSEGRAFKSIARSLPCLQQLHTLALGIFRDNILNPREPTEVMTMILCLM